MTGLIGRAVMFIPACTYKADTGKNKHEDAKPVRGMVVEEHREHGWFRFAYPAGKTVQYECFKFCDVGKEVTLIGRSKVD